MATLAQEYEFGVKYTFNCIVLKSVYYISDKINIATLCRRRQVQRIVKNSIFYISINPCISVLPKSELLEITVSSIPALSYLHNAKSLYICISAYLLQSKCTIGWSIEPQGVQEVACNKKMVHLTIFYILM